MEFESFPQNTPGEKTSREMISAHQSPWEQISRLARNRSRAIDEDVISRTKKKHPDFNFDQCKPPDRERLEHGNLDINFVGVYHTVETLAAYRKIIEAAIADADIVVLEAAINTSGAAIASGRVYETPFPAHGTVQSAALNVPRYELDTNSGAAFFSEVENMARMYQKQIVLFDPFSDQRFLQSEVRVRLQGGISHTARLDQLNQEVRQYSDLVAKAGAVVAGGSLAAGTIDGWRQVIKLTTAGREHNQEDYNRRSFLKRSSAYAASAGLGIGLTEKARENRAIIDFESPRDQEKITQYHQNDFRDVSIATGLDRLSTEFSKKMKVAIIYGVAHKSGIREYLENPRLRQAKLALYKPFRDIAPPEMTAYTYELDPAIASGERAVTETPESEWGYWKQTVQVRLD